jgi:hypothetical protein
MSAPTKEVAPEFRRGSVEIQLKGGKQSVPALHLGGATIFSAGKWLRIARLFDEELVERSAFPHPEIVRDGLQHSKVPADILNLPQRIPDVEPRFPYYMEWDNWAVAPASSFQKWWDALPQESRKNARQAEKRGVAVRIVPFDDRLAEGIKRIYDETPIRQGRPFWHYGKPLDVVKKENATYPERSTFVGAYVGDELIGFIKFVRVDDIAFLIQILAMAEHRDRKPMNALLKHTMEVCAQQNLSSVVYGQYHYGTNNDSTLTEFKRRNGFEEVRFPRYFIPLTTKGRIAVAAGLHHGIRSLIPQPVTSFLVNARSQLLKRKK